MKKTSLYFDSSIFNFSIADDVPHEREITLRLLEEARCGQYEVFISEVVIREIDKAPQKEKMKLRDALQKLNPEELSVTEEVQNLADKYINEGVIPAKYRNDALHIAVASVHGTDVIVSWNFEHIVKFKTKREVVGINLLSGYKGIEIYSPLEVAGNA